jgi:ABC-type dipeptide/oligopeptide/nickel transport system permease subunit
MTFRNLQLPLCVGVLGLVVLGCFSAYLWIPVRQTHANVIVPESALLPPGSRSEYPMPNPDNQTFSFWEGYQNTTADKVPKALQTHYHLLGTDALGRDVWSRVVLGGRASLFVAFTGLCLSLAIGVSFGLAAAWFGGWIDIFFTGLTTILWSIPGVVLAIVLSYVLGRGMVAVSVAVGLCLWVEVGRQSRNLTLGILSTGFIESARALGYSDWRIISRHVLPHFIGPLSVQACSTFASGLLLESGLSFLGLGVKPPAASWGVLLAEGYAFISLPEGLWLLLPPMVGIIGSTYCLQTITDALNTKQS